jgi:hypothetical protein
MKRIAALVGGALAALTLGSVPAMASTSGAAHTPRPVIRIACPVPRYGHLPPHAQIRLRKPVIADHKVIHYRVARFRCRGPVRVLCAVQVVRFDMPASGRAITEVSGPALHVGQEVFYRGTTYTVASVSGAVFTMSAGGQILVSRGIPVNEGIALTVGACR